MAKFALIIIFTILKNAENTAVGGTRTHISWLSLLVSNQSSSKWLRHWPRKPEEMWVRVQPAAIFFACFPLSSELWGKKVLAYFSSFHKVSTMSFLFLSIHVNTICKHCWRPLSSEHRSGAFCLCKCWPTLQRVFYNPAAKVRSAETNSRMRHKTSAAAYGI